MNLDDQIFRFQLGSFDCIAVSDGSFDYNPNHLFIHKNQVELKQIFNQHKISPEVVTTPYTFLFVNTGVQKVLVDMGAGNLGPNTGKMKMNLHRAGVSPEEIDTVIISHAHPDHIGGTLDEKSKPNYPWAKYYIWRKEWDFWFSEKAAEAVDKNLSKIVPAEIFINVARGQLGPVRDKMHFIDEEGEIFLGVKILFSPGHTPGHITVIFTSEGEELFVTNDTVIFPFLLEKLDMVATFDLDPREAAKSKKKIMNIVAERNAKILAQHFSPFPGMGVIKKKELGWKWEPI